MNRPEIRWEVRPMSERRGYPRPEPGGQRAVEGHLRANAPAGRNGVAA